MRDGTFQRILCTILQDKEFNTRETRFPAIRRNQGGVMGAMPIAPYAQSEDREGIERLTKT